MPGLARLPELVDGARRSGLDVEVVSSGTAQPLPPGVDLAAYRVVQEALTNTLKHAHATRSRVRLRWSDDTLHVEVEDDGVGAAVPAQAGGHGLVGMRERVAVCGGDLRAEPVPGGFVVQVRIPLEPVPAPA